MPVALGNLIPFILASALLLVIPGPTIVMVVSQAIAHGRRVALAGVLGVGLGDAVAASLSLTGVGTLLAASATGFQILRTLGAAYLVFVGIKMWRAPLPDFAVDDAAPRAGTGRKLFRDAFLVTVFNPKGIVFFMAFVPQFITPAHAFAPQAATLVATFVLLGIVNSDGYMRIADRARLAMRRPNVLRAATRAGAGLLVGAGVAALFARRAA